jgi:hypothetical protein
MTTIDKYFALRKIDDETWARILQLVNWRVAIDAEKAALTLEQTISTLLDSGMTRAEVRELLMNDLRGDGPVFADLRNGFKKSINGGVQQITQSVRSEVYTQNLEADMLYSWQLSPAADGKHCEDCEERDGREPMTWAEWEAIGIPKAGATVCGGNCYCDLVPVGGKE